MAAAGVTIAAFAGQVDALPLDHAVWLLFATSGLYAGGVVFNDVFDAGLDAVERPERPIPSGRSSLTGAIGFGSALLIGGVLAATQVSEVSGGIAAFIALAALLYDWKSKHFTWWGPLNMGLCRSANLLLGVSIVPALILKLSVIYLFPLIYIGAITAISQGEVHGGTSKKGWMAVGLLGLVVLIVIALPLLGYTFNLILSLPFLVVFVGMVAIPFVRAAQKPEAIFIRKAVRAGVLGLIPFNAALAAGFAGPIVGLVILLLLPISIGLGRLFAIT